MMAFVYLTLIFVMPLGALAAYLQDTAMLEAIAAYGVVASVVTGVSLVASWR